MPLGDVSEQQAFVSAYFGGGTPASFDAAIYTGSPYDGGVEVDYPSYARVTLTNDAATFVPGTDGSVTAEASFPDATGAAGTGSSVVTDDGLCWVLFNGTAITAWDYFDAPVTVDDAGTIEAVGITVYIPNDDNTAP
jgi:hypothetical protein